MSMLKFLCSAEEIEIHVLLFFLLDDLRSSSGWRCCCTTTTTCRWRCCNWIRRHICAWIREELLHLLDLLESEIDLSNQSSDIPHGVADHVRQAGLSGNTEFSAEGGHILNAS